MSSTEYPLISQLEAVEKKTFSNPDHKLHAIIQILEEEAQSRWKDDSSNSSLPVEIRRQSTYRWDVARCVFEDPVIFKMLQKQETINTVTKNHLLCVSLDEIFYEMAGTLFYHFYKKESGNGLTAEENNEIIKSIFCDEFDKLMESFDGWFVDHVTKMILPFPEWVDVEPVSYVEGQIKYYRTTYEGAFFMPYVEKAIQNVRIPTV